MPSLRNTILLKFIKMSNNIVPNARIGKIPKYLYKFPVCILMILVCRFAYSAYIFCHKPIRSVCLDNANAGLVQVTKFLVAKTFSFANLAKTIAREPKSKCINLTLRRQLFLNKLFGIHLYAVLFTKIGFECFNRRI